MITKLTFFKKVDIVDIPEVPETSNLWLLDSTHALWFTSYDNLWRFMLFRSGERTMRSRESFATKHAAHEFYREKKLTWTLAPITQEVVDILQEVQE